MLIYEGTKEKFLKDVEDDSLVEKIEKNLYSKMRRSSGKSEERSWENSLVHMYTILVDKEIPNDSGVAIEYNIPMTSKRVDFLISGYDKDNSGNVIIIELKQWEKLEAVEGKDGIVYTFTGGANRQTVHPSYQAWTYAMQIQDYNQAVQDENICLYPCAYLHNYKRIDNDPLDKKQYEAFIKDAPAFTHGQKLDLKEFIKKRIVKGDDEFLLYSIESGKVRPSKSLQDCIAKMVKGNQEFIMLDEQKVVYENVLSASRASVKDQKKRVIIVKGGPGTGKSVVAINLLSQLTQEGEVCQYVSKNSAPRNVYCKKLKGEVQKSSIDNLFKSSGIFENVEKNALDTVLVDEAHRLREKEMMCKVGRNQIREIIYSAKCSVFFIDERQRVTLQDIGSVDEIMKWAKEAGAEVSTLELLSQFRCNGSDGYLAWLDNVLEITNTESCWDLGGINFDFRVMDSPQQVYDLILQKNKECKNRARMLAGYCWEWQKAGKNDPEAYDIKIGDFGISWNLGRRTTYAIDEDSVYEAGCIHTAQGLEFDYVGVIIGDDMRYENGKILTDASKRAKSDQSLRGLKKMEKENPEKAQKVADEIIKNTYRTLMTRGMKGCYVYCTDKNLADYLKKSMETNKI